MLLRHILVLATLGIAVLGMTAGCGNLKNTQAEREHYGETLDTLKSHIDGLSKDMERELGSVTEDKTLSRQQVITKVESAIDTMTSKSEGYLRDLEQSSPPSDLMPLHQFLVSDIQIYESLLGDLKEAFRTQDSTKASAAGERLTAYEKERDAKLNKAYRDSGLGDGTWASSAKEMISMKDRGKGAMAYGLPISSWLIFAWFGMACIHTHNKRIWQAASRGELPEGDEAPPAWLGWIILPQYVVLAYLAYIDWKQALSIFVITFLLSVLLRIIMDLTGAILMMPFVQLYKTLRKKPAGAMAGGSLSRGPADSRGVRISERDRIDAANLVISAMSSGDQNKEHLVTTIRNAFPALSDKELFRAIRVAAKAMLGYGTPEQFVDPDDEDDAKGSNAELAQLEANLEEAKADVDLLLLGLYRERIHEGRFYDPVEGTMTPLEASAVVMRFGHALEVSPRECSPFARLSELSDSKIAIFNACKVLYISRWDDDQQREHLSSGVGYIHNFVEDEAIDEILRESDGDHRLSSKRFGVLLTELSESTTKTFADWSEFTTGVDRRMEEIHAEAEAEASTD